VAIFYMDVKIIGRSSGRSAVGAAAYRSGEKLSATDQEPDYRKPDKTQKSTRHVDFEMPHSGVISDCVGKQNLPFALEHAAYQSGEKLQGKSSKDSKHGKIIHDYTKKQGVVYKSIMLPDNAPYKFYDRETLWNAVEASEKRKDAQLSREIIVALPQELNFFEQVDIIRAYVRENFVKIGICADIAIHDKEDANPHAHIMLTTRNVTPEGFGAKNTDWNKKYVLYSWRENWAAINNRLFETKGLNTRIDHRTLKAQGLDREPTIHLGHQAAALEKKGIKTERGDYNREVQRRNETRTALNSALGRLLTEQLKERDEQRATLSKEAKKMEMQETMQFIKELQQQQQEYALQIIRALHQQQPPQTPKALKHTHSTERNTGANAEVAPNEVITKLTTANRVSEMQDTFLSSDEKSRISKENRVIKPNVIKMAKQRRNLRNIYTSTYWDLRVLKSGRNVVESENFNFKLDIEEIDEKAKNVQALLDRVPQLEAERQNQHFWNWRRKKELDKAIAQAEHDSKKALLYFGRRFHVNPDEIERIIVPIRKKIKANEPKIADKDDQIAKVEKKFAKVKQEFDNYRIEHKIKVR
jgi:hypothetical protein